jgi:transposase
MSSMQIGVDLAKSVFEVAVSTVPGRVRERRRLARAALTGFFAAQPPSEVFLEACGSAHHWGRELRRLGHTVALLPASDVARYRAGTKTDRADATALLEAARNEKISRVPVKSIEQQAVLALHRIRRYDCSRPYAIGRALALREESRYVVRRRACRSGA